MTTQQAVTNSPGSDQFATAVVIDPLDKIATMFAAIATELAHVSEQLRTRPRDQAGAGDPGTPPTTTMSVRREPVDTSYARPDQAAQASDETQATSVAWVFPEK